MTKISSSANRGINSSSVRPFIRDMERRDLERVGEILYRSFSSVALQRGYAPRIDSVQEGISWAWAVLRHGPNDVLVAEIDDHVAGVCCLNTRGVNGGVGPVAVDPSFHGNGIGRQLMEELLKRAEGLQSVRLFQEAFNPASFSLYYPLGFTPVAELLDMYVDKGDLKTVNSCGNVQEPMENDLDEVCMYDMHRSGFDRKRDLEYYLKWGKILLYRDRSGIRGYLASLPGSQSVQLGPLVAEDEEGALCLFQHALSIYPDSSFQTRMMARDHTLAMALKELGFRLYCVDLLMIRGSWRPGNAVEAFGRFPEGV